MSITGHFHAISGAMRPKATACAGKGLQCIDQRGDAVLTLAPRAMSCELKTTRASLPDVELASSLLLSFASKAAVELPSSASSVADGATPSPTALAGSRGDIRAVCHGSSVKPSSAPFRSRRAASAVTAKRKACDLASANASGLKPLKAARASQARLSESQARVLETCFARNRHPSSTERESLARQTQLSPDYLKVWFCTRRAKSRREQVRVCSDLDAIEALAMDGVKRAMMRADSWLLCPSGSAVPDGSNRND